MWNDLNSAFENAELDVKLPAGEYVGAIKGCSFTEAKQGTIRWVNFYILVQLADKKDLIGTVAKESLIIASEKEGVMQPNNISLAIVKTIAKGTFGDISGMDFSTILQILPQAVIDTTITFSIKETAPDKNGQTWLNFYLTSASRKPDLDATEDDLPF